MNYVKFLKFAIVINTYKRKDGKTKYFLERVLQSIKDQTYKNYKVFLIGDKYEDNTEFESISNSIIESKNIFYKNLEIAKERDLYVEGEKLWCSGGVNSRNYGIEKALEEGFEYICSLDHDEYWSNNHLESLYEFIKENEDYSVITSRCNYLNIKIVPVHSKSGEYLPVAGDVVHSSVCINFKKINLRYRDVYAETGKTYPSDADLWNRIKNLSNENKNIKGFLLENVTVILDKQERK